MEKRYRASGIGLIEYELIDNTLYYNNSSVPNIKTYKTAEEADIAFFLQKRENLISDRVRVEKELKHIDKKIEEMNSEYSLILSNNPEMLI